MIFPLKAWDPENASSILAQESISLIISNFKQQKFHILKKLGGQTPGKGSEDLKEPREKKRPVKIIDQLV